MQLMVTCSLQECSVGACVFTVHVQNTSADTKLPQGTQPLLHASLPAFTGDLPLPVIVVLSCRECNQGRVVVAGIRYRFRRALPGQ